MLESYFNVFVFLGIAFVIGCVLLIVGRLFSTSKPDDVKLAPYECGFPEFEDARMPFGVKFYLVAILFIIFDLETAFLFPWAIVLQQIGWVGYSVMMIFLYLLIVGFIYEWRRGALEWE